VPAHQSLLVTSMQSPGRKLTRPAPRYRPGRAVRQGSVVKGGAGSRAAAWTHRSRKGACGSSSLPLNTMLRFGGLSPGTCRARSRHTAWRRRSCPECTAADLRSSALRGQPGGVQGRGQSPVRVTWVAGIARKQPAAIAPRPHRSAFDLLILRHDYHFMKRLRPWQAHKLTVSNESDGDSHRFHFSH